MTDSKCGALPRRRESDASKGFNRLRRTSLFAPLALGSLVGVVAALSAAGPALADEPGWVLTQRSEQMGDSYIYVSANGFKWVNPKSGANVVTTGPSWNVTMYNEKSKMYYDTSFDNWKRQIASTGGQRAVEMRNNPWVQTGTGVVAGVKATKYSMKGGSVGNVQRMKNGQIRKTLSTVQGAECWVSEEIAVPAPVASMLSQAYGMPQTKYFPLRVTYVNSGRPGTALDTLNSKSCNIPASFFAKPQGYLLAKSQAEVLMDDETKQILRDMASEFDESPRGAASGGNNATASPSPVPQARPAATVTPSNTVQVGGVNLDKDKLTKLLQQLKNGGAGKPAQK